MIEKLIKFMNNKALSPNALFLLCKDVLDIDIGILIPAECGYPDTLSLLQNSKYIKITDVDKLEYELRQKGVETVKEFEQLIRERTVVITPKKPVSTDKKETAKEINEWLEDYRNLFKGLKPGSKGDKGSCLNKMVRFFEEYPEFADRDIIMKATQNYIDSEANQNYKYLQRADYFIYKLQGKEDTSRLASFCDEVDEKEEEGMTKML